jgi:hypothetical protein
MVALSHAPASDRSIVAATFVAISLFVGSWTLLHLGFYTHKQILDTPVLSGPRSPSRLSRRCCSAP